eukprot:gnl/MRDRNA2_/MRDRNA2_63125_c0_seq1.p1 gnl/MRDRNA2_/MRDRNA2_63125_c0~~gnl/MRDRNA2_/MRDRNA2_63125_c0_seq1.p1  ORF type:complete len:203 (+),score=33.17 gnl/MRDRNA2_/MRDRNA2_63125_c0_seq1:75-683(+)
MRRKNTFGMFATVKCVLLTGILLSWLPVDALKKVCSEECGEGLKECVKGQCKSKGKVGPEYLCRSMFEFVQQCSVFNKLKETCGDKNFANDVSTGFSKGMPLECARTEKMIALENMMCDELRDPSKQICEKTTDALSEGGAPAPSTSPAPSTEGASPSPSPRAEDESPSPSDSTYEVSRAIVHHYTSSTLFVICLLHIIVRM